MIEIMSFVKTENLTSSLIETIKSIAQQCLLTHKTKADILNDMKKQLDWLKLTPGTAESLRARIL